MRPATWSPDDIGDQGGRTVVVTGPSLGGIGHHTALELARRGARVVLAGRSPGKLAATSRAIADEVGPDRSEPVCVVLDLADLASVRRAADEVAELGPVDVLVNNAGVMATAPRRTTDGFEVQLATNHLGPFLLTGLLLPALAASGDGVVVTVSSLFHARAKREPWENPVEDHHHRSRWRTYSRTKLANLLFTYELDRRCAQAGTAVRALAAHPGFAATHLAANGIVGRSAGPLASIVQGAVRALAQSPSAGAWPSLMAATADLPGSTYVGPGGLGELSGVPQVVGSSELSRDADAQRRLWEVSEKAVGLCWP